MAESMIITPVIGKSIDVVSSQTYQKLRYLWKYKSNIASLRTSMTSLERTRDDVRLLIVEAKNKAELIGSIVEEWLEEVEVMKNEVDDIIQASGSCQVGCFLHCTFPNIKVRYSVSKKAVAKTDEILKLLRKGEFPRVGYPAPIGERPLTSPRDVFGFQSRLQVEKDVMKALMDDNITVLAVCGMGGVGKTTMVKKIADEIKKENHFNEVVMAIVSQNYDPIHVQQQLAEKLGLEIKETTFDARADRLHTRLMDQEKRILIIIDDLWKEIDLYAIGIPSKAERKGLKVIMTSRYSRVCSQMDVNKILNVQELIEEEAWDLFKEHANISDDFSDELEGYAKKVAKKCQGLPLAIEVIGKTLKNRKEPSEWRDALQQLQSAQDRDNSEDIYDKVYSSIEWSVNYLGGQCRSLLLLCSLFPEDHEIELEDLVRYAKGMQLFKGIEKMTQIRDRAEKMCNELKDCYLLIACDNHSVKLHDVVRDTCLRIASEGDNVHMVSHSKQKEWPDKDTFESYTAISLSFHNLDELPSGLMCSRLELLRLSYHRSNNMKITTSFLQAMKKVRVLNINFSSVQVPPQSIQSSISLRTLNLHDCNIVGDFSALLESLVNLEVLSFFKSSYEGNWPKEIAKLTNLKSLDLRCNSINSGARNSFPTGILIHLMKLEELYLGFELDVCLPESYEIIREIGSLSSLNTMEFARCDSHFLAVLVENLDVGKLLRFYISPKFESSSPYQFNRTMIVHETNMDMLLEPKMKALVRNVDEHFQVSHATGYLVKDFVGDSVSSRLRSLKIDYCDMKYVFNSNGSSTRAGVFVDLKRLYICGAKYLEEICHGDVPSGSFASLEEVSLLDVPLLRCLWGPIKPPCLGNLEKLKLFGGKMITSLFLRSSVKCFARLRNIEISSFPKLETLVSCEGQIEKDIVEDKVEFPELVILRLEGVDSFRTFCSELNSPTVSLCSTISTTTMFPKLRSLVISEVRHLHAVDVIKNGQNLSSLDISDCISLEECFDFEGWLKEITAGEVPENVFHKLKSLTLDELPDLRHLWRKIPEGIAAFQNLKTLNISRCESLKQLLTQSMAKMLVNLKRLDIRECSELEAIVGLDETSPSGKASTSAGVRIFEQLEHLELSYLPRLRNFQRIVPEGIVAFQKLSSLVIDGCVGFRYLFTHSTVKAFASLESLEIHFCEQMESIIGSDEELEEDATSEVVDGEEEILLPELFHLKLSGLPKFKMICFPSNDLNLRRWDNIIITNCPMFKN